MTLVRFCDKIKAPTNISAKIFPKPTDCGAFYALLDSICVTIISEFS
nr:MAG TPA: hypothetical protein [Caudoviricetes sp.]DAO20021.1 MAG TPA: hypothetical protein [Caudoviricetes sp.]